jgi:hypothetical protein
MRQVFTPHQTVSKEHGCSHMDDGPFKRAAALQDWDCRLIVHGHSVVAIYFINLHCRRLKFGAATFLAVLLEHRACLGPQMGTNQNLTGSVMWQAHELYSA